jgi:membrane protease YdiL (CAAX protease family)
VLVATLALAAVLLQFLPPPPSVLPETAGPVDTLLILIAAAVVAPIGEEIFFRAFSTTAWARSMSARSAIIRGGVFFALAHIVTLGGEDAAVAGGQALVAFVARLPVGIALGWLFLRRRSIYAPIGLHAVFNAIQVVLVAANPGG